MPELWIWDPSLPPGELCSHCNLAVVSQEYIGSFFCVLLAVTERSSSVSQFSRSVVSDSLQLFAACQGSLSITNSQSSLKLMFIELVMPSNHLILCRPLLLLPSIFLSIRSFPVSQFFASGGQSIGVSASTSVLPMNIQDWFPLGWTGWISLQSKELSRVFSNTTVQKHQFFSTLAFFIVQVSHPYMTSGKTIALTIWTCDRKQSDVSAF